MKNTFILFFLMLSFNLKSQNVGIGTNTPRAALDVTSTSSGFLPPRLTFAQVQSIQNPIGGLVVWCKDCSTSGQLLVHNGASWTAASFGSVSPPLPLHAHSCGANNIHNAALTYGTMSDQDGNIYKTIQIGTQVWMAENLKARRYRNGDIIPLIDNSGWSSLTTGASCWYSNDSAANNCPLGKLYNWYAVADSRKICPTGWHVPTDAEFSTLTSFLGGESVAGGKMKSTSTLWNSPNTGADNSSGFSALPGGLRISLGSYFDIGVRGCWWSATENLSDYGWYRFISNDVNTVTIESGVKEAGFSVRCLKD